MGQMLLHRPRFQDPEQRTRATPARDEKDPAAAARGILLALAISSLFWVALALLVPLLFW